MNMIDHFEKIIEMAKENGLNDAFFGAAKEHLDAVCSLMHISPVQAALFAMILERFGNSSVSLDKIAETLKCGKMQLLRYMDDLDALKKKKLIRASQASDFLERTDSFPKYSVPMDVINAVRNNVEYQYTALDNLGPEDFFDCAEDLIRAVKDGNLDIYGLREEVNFLLAGNKDICFVRKQSEYDLGEDSVILMLVFCCAIIYRDIESYKSDDLWKELYSIYGRIMARQVQERFKTREHKLFKKGLIEFEFQNGMADTDYLRLSQTAKDEFLADFDFKKKSKHQGRGLIHGDTITSKKLFYSTQIKSRIAELTEMLREENFSGIRKRLEESGMRTGFACIFSGPPGTGKTETAYQIARETGRDIMLVDISNTKSMWFGESEKRIKAVFDRYRGIVKNNGLVPILLFNEADAVFGKRRELAESRSGPDQTENAIQNIILQEMENLNGILIATTNMTVNFDKAFERRFLYKINFEKPDLESKRLMWQSFIPALTDSDARNLAAKFDFSGGQIENIARKSAVSFILKGAAPDISSLETFCGEESFEKAASGIGFRAC